MSDITPSQMYCALLKAAATVKEDAQMNCPYYNPFIPTSKGESESMCEHGEIATKCAWPYECPLLARAAKEAKPEIVEHIQLCGKEPR